MNNLGEIFQVVASGLLLYSLKMLLDKIVNRKYPEGEELVLAKKRFEVYKKMYYELCIDFESGESLIVDFPKEEVVEKFSRMYLQYLYHSADLSELLSFPLQQAMRNYAENHSANSFRSIQLKISNDYFHLCNALNYTVLSKENELKKYQNWQIYLSFASILSIIIAIVLEFLNLFLALIFLALGIILFVLASIIYSKFVKSSF